MLPANYRYVSFFVAVKKKNQISHLIIRDKIMINSKSLLRIEAVELFCEILKKANLTSVLQPN